MYRIFVSLCLTALAALTSVYAGEPNQDEVQFERREFTISRVRGDVLIDGIKAGKDLVSNQVQEVLLIEAFDGLKFNDDKEFRDWTRHLRGVRTYVFDDVIKHAADGSITRTPLVLLPPEIRATTEPLWQAWIDERARAEQNAKTAYDQQQAENYRLDQLQQSAQAQTEELIAQTRLLAVASGATDLWEIRLTNRNSQSWGQASQASLFSAYANSNPCGDSGCITIQVTARDSQSAVDSALDQYKGYQLVSARKLAGQ
jgi:hypothetical protein